MFLEELDALNEVQAFVDHHQVNGVEVFLTAEASGEIGFGLCCGLEFGAQGAEEAKDSLDDFCGDVEDGFDEETDGDVVSHRKEFLGRIASIHVRVSFQKVWMSWMV